MINLHFPHKTFCIFHVRLIDFTFDKGKTFTNLISGSNYFDQKSTVLEIDAVKLIEMSTAMEYHGTNSISTLKANAKYLHELKS